MHEYSEKMTNCRKWGAVLVRTEEGEGDCHNCKTEFDFPKENVYLCYVSEEAMAKFVAMRLGNGFAHIRFIIFPDSKSTLKSWRDAIILFRRYL